LLIGHLGKDPEIRYTPDGAAVASFSIATSENFTDKNGTRQERTEWHSVKAFGKLADICKQYLTKLGRSTSRDGFKLANTQTAKGLSGALRRSWQTR